MVPIFYELDDASKAVELDVNGKILSFHCTKLCTILCQHFIKESINYDILYATKDNLRAE